uniref:Uncharacterized protein n=1 Tax=Fusarium oxysporum (strain Fo5176) TaxID=660025 RepID=A0A0D2Y715_FUSOF
MHRDVMAFVHRHRSEITAAFLEICLSQSEVEPGEIRDQSGSMSLQERMDLWDKNEDLDGTSVEEGLESLEIWERDEEDISKEIWILPCKNYPRFSLFEIRYYLHFHHLIESAEV